MRFDGEFSTFSWTVSALEMQAKRNLNATSAAAPPISPAPEIDPAGFGSVAALVTGVLGLIERRRRRMKAA